MKKTFFYLAAILIAVITMSLVSNSKAKKYSEKEFIEIINQEGSFTDIEIKELIDNTEFETLNAKMIRRCDGTDADYCQGNPPPGVPRPKCCYKPILQL